MKDSYSRSEGHLEKVDKMRSARAEALALGDGMHQSPQVYQPGTSLHSSLGDLMRLALNRHG